MKRTLCLFLSLVMALSILTTVPVTVSAGSYDYLRFTLNSDGVSYSVRGCDNSVSDELVIPATYDGKPVTVIEDRAFITYEHVKSIVIPQTVTNIGSYAFSACENLETVIIPSGVKTIGAWAFNDCPSLTSISIPDSVTDIGDCAFRLCASLESIVLPEGITQIGAEFFSNCTSLKSVTIPETVERIYMYAFNGCKSLESIVIPGNVISINEGAFSGCGNMTSVWIPDSITWVGYGAFDGCDNLEDVYYAGSKTQWNTVKFERNNDYLLNANLHYKNGNCAHTSTKWIIDKKATVNAAGSKHKECTACGETFGTAKIAQLKPGRTTVKATTTSTGVKITWSKVTGADKYTVYRKTGDGSYKALKTVTGTSYTDTTAKSGTKYRYNVKAKNEAGYGEYAKTGATKLFLATPKVTVSNASSGVTVKWNKITGAKGYYVYRKTGSGSYTKIATIKSGSTVSYTDKKASAGKIYTYYVKAYNGDYVSSYKAATAIEFLKAPSLKSVSSGKSGVTVKWAKTTGADGYYVYRKEGSGSYKKISTVKGNSKVSYLDKSAKKGKTYTYYVKAYSGNSVSTSSKTLKIKDKY